MSTKRSTSWVAVDPAVDRLRQARRVRRAHDAFHAGGNVCAQVRRVVGASWGRSGDAGVDADQLPEIVMDDREVDDRWRRHPLSAVRPTLREFLGDASSSEHVLVISDASGVILWVEGRNEILAATRRRRVVPGADWSEPAAGTNAVGTTIAVGHPVQIFSAEHFSRAHHGWQSSSAPIHDPDTGVLLGTVALTGHLRTAHPHTLSLVGAAARLAEMTLRERSRARDEALRDSYLARVVGKRQSTALIAHGGRMLLEAPRRWLPPSVDVPDGGGELLLADGRLVTAEPLAGSPDAYILWGPPPSRATGTRAPAPVALELALLGRAPSATVHGERLPLKLRHAELLALLLLDGRGLTADELATELYGAAGKAVTVRAELSRLRRALSGVLHARPYRLVGGARADLVEVRNAVADADVRWLLDRYPAPLLADSEVPRIVAVREQLDAAVRDRVLRSEDAAVLVRWCAHPSGAQDAEAADLLVALRPADDHRRSPAAARPGHPR